MNHTPIKETIMDKIALKTAAVIIAGAYAFLIALNYKERTETNANRASNGLPPLNSDTFLRDLTKIL
jgi:hypothetical protein